jgi:DNA-binding PadR family transcriptional regulator
MPATVLVRVAGMVDDLPAPDHKRLLLLGLLREGPRHGYELNRVVRAHGTIYADLGRANIYYLLERMAGEGLVAVEEVAGARGSRGSRLVYRITDTGRARFTDLLRSELTAYDAIHPGVDVAIVLADSLPRPETIDLLRRRREIVAARQAEITAELAAVPAGALLPKIAADHLRTLVDAELTWIDHALTTLARHTTTPARRQHTRT